MTHGKRMAALLLLCSTIYAAGPAPALIAQEPGRAATAQTQTPAAQRPQAGAATAADPNDPVERIKDEGMNRSQVMQTLMYLTDVIGPRLTNSPQMKRANEWTRDQLAKWGLQNAHLEAWGPFGRGWSLRRFSAEVVEPQGFPVIAYPKAWSPSTNGVVTADVVYVDAKTEADLEKYRGQLAGKVVMTSPIREIKALFDAPGSRLTEKQLLELANAPDPSTVPARQRNYNMSPEMIQGLILNIKRANFVINEGAAVVIEPGRGDGGTVFVQGASVPTPIPADLDTSNPQALMSLFFRRGGPTAYSKDAPKIPPQVVMAAEHYNRIVRMLQAGERVKLSLNVDAQFHDQDLMGYNTIAEIPGTDPALKDEIVMLGGHMDSWHGGTGATDNGAGVAVSMEAVRIIQALGLKPRRTIRIGLWSGEEQGLLGSRAYVKEHFGELQGGQQSIPGMPSSGAQGQLVKKPAYDKFSVYFNLDNGTGRIRGVYMQGNAAAWPIFSRWLRPFNSMGASTLSMSNTGGTDHLAFDAIGLPGFQFIQDEVEYSTRTHHSNMDTFDRIQADDMKQAATIMAAFVYQAATMDQRFPRKPAPGTSREVSDR